MSKIRQLHLDITDKFETSAVPISEFIIPERKQAELRNILEEIIKLDYWDARYQAWEPFLLSYLTSGADPDLASKWIEPVMTKVVEFTPKASRYHDILGEYVKLCRKRCTEAFHGYQWEQLTNFASRCKVYSDCRKDFKKLMNSMDVYTTIMQNMLAKEDDALYSCNLPYAILMFRKSQIIRARVPDEIMAEAKAQLISYVQVLSDEFDRVTQFLDAKTEIYAWYTPVVKDSILSVWSASFDVQNTSSYINVADAYSMPVWLSEQLSSYVASLPSCCVLPTDEVYVLDALETVIADDVDFSSPNVVYAFTVSEAAFAKFCKRIFDFFCQVKNQTLAVQVYHIVKFHVESNPEIADELPNPEAFKQDLIRRGFPLGEDV